MITTTETKRKGRIPLGKRAEIERKVIECNKTLQHPTQQNVADATGICRQTVANILAKYSINQQELEHYRENQADILLGLQQRITKHIADDDIKRAPMRDKMVALGIAIDKHRLVTGQSTSNVSNWTMIVNKAQGAVLNDSTACGESKVIDVAVESRG